MSAADPDSSVVRLVLAAVVGLVVVAALIGTVVMWPGDDSRQMPEGYQSDRTRTEITALEKCPEGDGCLLATATVDDREVAVRLPVGEGSPSFSVGDEILVSAGAETGDNAQYSFLDFDRSTPLLWLIALFVFAIVLLSRWRGLASLVSLALSLVAVTQFVLPALLDGRNPLLVALTAAALIMVVTIYSSQGINVRSSVAVTGTLAALAVAGTIGGIFTSLGKFTGFSDESTKFLVAVLGEVDVRGLLLAGIIIGALGVLDDVTVTQTAAVWEIAAADPTASRREIFAGAMRIGRAHVSATVNTLVLAYVGASLPLLLLLSAMDASAMDQLLSEGIGQEVVRSLAGSLGIVAAVPLTTALAVGVVSRRPRDAAEPAGPASPIG